MMAVANRLPEASAKLEIAESRVDYLFSVADAVDVSAFHIVGESYGGTIALMAGLTRPAA